MNHQSRNIVDGFCCFLVYIKFPCRRANAGPQFSCRVIFFRLLRCVQNSYFIVFRWGSCFCAIIAGVERNALCTFALNDFFILVHHNNREETSGLLFRLRLPVSVGYGRFKVQIPKAAVGCVLTSIPRRSCGSKGRHRAECQDCDHS